jgi:hypothetical protein
MLSVGRAEILVLVGLALLVGYLFGLATAWRGSR